MKYLILGGRSYLGKSFSQYLKKNNNQVIALNEENSNFYSTNLLKEVINNENPQKIVDFKFPIVSSNNDAFNNIDLENILNTQERLIESLNQLPDNNSDLYLISTLNISKRENIYTQYKKKQEEYYKNHLSEKNKFKILRLETVLGEGDVSTNRLVPYFFSKVFENKKLNLNINSRRKGEYIFIKECNNFIFNSSIDKTYKKNAFTLTYKNLIFRLSSILEYEYNFYHKVFWNNQKIITKEVDKTDKTNQSLIELTNWYIKNKESFKVG